MAVSFLEESNLANEGIFSLSEGNLTLSLESTGPRALARAEDLSASTDFTSLDVVDSSDIDGVVQGVKQKYGDALANSVQFALSNRPEPTQAARQMSIQAQQIARSMGHQDFFIEESLNIDNPMYDPDQVNFMINYRQFAERLSTELEKEWEDATWLGIGKDFLTEIIRATLVGDWQDLTGVGADRGQEMLEILKGSPDDFSERSEEWLANNSSLLGNFFEKAQLYQDALNSGYDPHEASRQFWGAVGLAGTVATLPFAGAKAVSIAQKAGRGIQAWRSARKAVNTSEVVEEGVPNVARPNHMGSAEVHFSENNSFENSNTLIQKIIQDKGKGFFGYEATAEEIQAAIVSATTKFENLFNRTISSVTPPTWRNPVLTFTLGKSNGRPFSSLRAAEKFATDLRKQGYVAKVIEEPTKASERFRVEVKQGMSFQMTAPAMQLPEVSNAITELYKKVFGSGAMFDMDGHVATLKAHNGLRSISKTVKPYFDRVNKLEKKRANTLYQIMDEVRDGADASVRASFTDSQLAERWFRKTGEAEVPADVLDAYRAIKSVEEAAYWMDAQIILRDFITNGYDAVVIGGRRYIAKPVSPDEITGNPSILHAPSKTVVRKNSQEINTLLEKGNKIYQVYGDEIKISDSLSVEYVVGAELDVLKYSDVLNYNHGGHRSYKAGNYFLTVGSGQGKAFMVARTSKEADLAITELKAIQKEYLSLGRPLEELTDELDEIIAANTNWNKNVENTQDLKEFASRYNLNLDGDLGVKAKDGLVEDVQSPFYKRPHRLYYGNQRTRADNPLLNVGGDLPSLDSSIKSIFDGVESSAYQFSFADATQRMQASWLKAFWARGMKSEPHINPSVLFQKAGEELKSLKNKTPYQEQLIDEWDAINRRLSVKDSVTLKSEELGRRLQEFVLGKFGETAAANIPGAEDLIRLGFQSAFGFLNTSAFIVQAAQVPLIMAISPRAGSRAALGVRSFIMALNTGSEASIQRLAKVLSVTDTEAKEILEYFHTTRPHDVLMSSIDKNTMLGFGYSLNDGNATAKGLSSAYMKFRNVGGKVLQFGLKPYELGEQYTVTTAHLTAILEFLERNPGVKLATGADSITRRASALTSNMNSAARGAFQSGIWRIPTQWLSYSFRSLEMMVSGRHLNKIERARMALYFLTTSGVGVLGVDSAADYLAEQLGADPADPNYYTLVRYGVYDAILSYGLSELTDSEVRTALGSRIAPFDGIADLVAKINEKAVPEVVLGPSGAIAGTGFGKVFDALQNLWNGYDYASGEDLETAFRGVSSFNNIAAVFSMLKSDAVRSRNGTTVPVKTNPAQAILKTLGVPSQAEKEIYTLRTAAYMTDKEVRAFRKEVFRLYDIALNVSLKEGDQEEFTARIKELAAMINESDLSEYDKEGIKRTLRTYRGDDLTRMLLKFSERNQEYYRAQLEKIGAL